MPENKEEDEGYDESGDREPRVPVAPNKSGGAFLPLPEPEHSEEDLVGCLK